MPRQLKLLLIIITSLIAIIACGLLFLYLYNHPQSSNNDLKGGCCTCLDCPYCDVCCDCSNPYLSN